MRNIDTFDFNLAFLKSYPNSESGFSLGRGIDVS